jgi:hypothetical protein
MGIKLNNLTEKELNRVFRFVDQLKDWSVERGVIWHYTLGQSKVIRVKNSKGMCPLTAQSGIDYPWVYQFKFNQNEVSALVDAADGDVLAGVSGRELDPSYTVVRKYLEERLNPVEEMDKLAEKLCKKFTDKVM